MKKALVFDDTGTYIEDKIVEDDYEPTENEVVKEIDEAISFYKPILVNGEVVEGLLEEEINEIKNAPILPTTEERVDELETKIIYTERIKTSTEIYDENKDKTDISLEDLKQLRINKLKDECSLSIYEGFTSGSNIFGFNITDQANFTQQLLLVVSGDSADIQWKTRNNGVVTLTALEFKQVCSDAEAHKRSQQFIYWEKEQLVLAATTHDEVKAIQW